MENAERINV